MTPQDALAAALFQTSIGCEGHGDSSRHLTSDHREDGAALLAALPAGWRLTDEPEVTQAALARVLHKWKHPSYPLGLSSSRYGAGCQCRNAAQRLLRGAS